MVADVAAMSSVDPWTCHWPTKPALAATVAEVAVELGVLLGFEVFSGVPLAEALAEVIVELEPGSAVGVFFEQPAKPTTTISAAAAEPTAYFRALVTGRPAATHALARSKK
jgi:hypothetical protein